MHKKISGILAGLTACGLMVGCAPEQAATSAGFDSQASGQVHYEATNDKGDFTEHREIADPMASEYETGVWRASKKSLVSTQATSSSTSNRVNIVFVGDGYTQADLAGYAKDASSIQTQFLKQAPFASYAPYFSFHRVDVVSKDSGVTNDKGGNKKSTALGMTYGCDGIDRLLCVNLSKAMSEAQNAPAVDAVFAMANSAVYGGAGYWSPPISTFAAKNAGSIELALHEFGHSFGKLTDEYDTAGVLDSCTSYANTATVSATTMKAQKTKWYRWLGTQGVDAFKGSCYSLSYYRPHLNSRMRALSNPYGAVNVEQLILKIYARVKPIDAATPTGTTYAATSGTLWVTPMKPADHSLTVAWKIDGKAQTSLTGKLQVALASLNLASGSHKVSVTVSDLNAAVKDEAARAASMTQTLTYNVQR